MNLKPSNEFKIISHLMSDEKVSYTVRMQGIKGSADSIWFEFTVTQRIIANSVTSPSIVFHSKLLHPYIDDQSGESQLLTRQHLSEKLSVERLLTLIKEAILEHPEQIRDGEPALNKEAEYLCKSNTDTFTAIAIIRAKREATKLV